MLEISKYPVNVSNFTNLNIIIIMNDDMIKFLFEFNLEKTLGRRYPNGINWTKEIIHCFIEMLCSGTKFVEWQIASKYESPPILLKDIYMLISSFVLAPVFKIIYLE